MHMHIGAVMMVGSVIPFCHDGSLNGEPWRVVVFIPLADAFNGRDGDDTGDQKKNNAKKNRKNVKHE